MIIANLFLILPLSAAETECYFLNENGVCFQEEEYLFLTEMYWEGIQKMFTQNQRTTKDITAFRLCTSPLTTKNLIFDVEIFLWSYIPNCYLENLCLSVIGDTNIFQTDDISLVKLY